MYDEERLLGIAKWYPIRSTDGRLPVQDYELTRLIAFACALQFSVCLFFAEKFLFKSFDRYPEFAASNDRKRFIACMIGADITNWSLVGFVWLLPYSEFAALRCLVALVFWAFLNGWIFGGLLALRRFSKRRKNLTRKIAFLHSAVANLRFTGCKPNRPHFTFK